MNVYVLFKFSFKTGFEPCYEAMKQKLASISEAKKKNCPMDSSDGGQTKKRRRQCLISRAEKVT